MSEIPGLKYENGASVQGQASGPLPTVPPHLAALNTSGSPGSVPPPPGAITSPISAGGTVRRAAPEPNRRVLYVGGLDQRVTEEVLRQIFETAGHVLNVKIIPDKTGSNPGANEFPGKSFNYGFVEYEDVPSAERAMQTLNGRSIHQNEIRVNWAYQSNNVNKEDTTNHFHIFVGDLSNEVNDEILLKAFSAFGTVSEARVMWDMKTGRSRGYGFVAFRDQGEAEKALSAMDGEWLGSRAIRCNWANQKGQPSTMQRIAPPVSYAAAPFGQYALAQSPQVGPMYNTIVSQTPHWQTTIYVGNLTPYTTQNDLLPWFQAFGFVVETRLQSDRGFAFVKMDTHEHAAMAICQINGQPIHGRPLKCSWGKDRPTGTGSSDGGYNPQRPQAGFGQTAPTGYFPQYATGPNPMSPMGQNPTNQFAQNNPAGYGQAYATQNFGRNHFQGQSAGAYGGNFQASPY